eukprot:gnl/TRDRNA2_/TRDRNA2_125413_c0_seq2.p1 gnl/TRDRNA2_/TRDRNA2_125413_c0~~gnl/TRDRNA2_/TRDRNA2_125413_c0_seq2.p1  ORF type:complete len:101 (-),score=7.48 gnl/TRDRNA2_/TRDRNA2_125413_c0_seq2:95-397(-)
MRSYEIGIDLFGLRTASGGGEEGAGVAGGVDGGVVSQIDAKLPTESLHTSPLTNAEEAAELLLDDFIELVSLLVSSESMGSPSEQSHAFSAPSSSIENLL